MWSSRDPLHRLWFTHRASSLVPSDNTSPIIRDRRMSAALAGLRGFKNLALTVRLRLLSSKIDVSFTPKSRYRSRHIGGWLRARHRSCKLRNQTDCNLVVPKMEMLMPVKRNWSVQDVSLLFAQLRFTSLKRSRFNATYYSTPVPLSGAVHSIKSRHVQCTNLYPLYLCVPQTQIRPYW